MSARCATGAVDALTFDVAASFGSAVGGSAPKTSNLPFHSCNGRIRPMNQTPNDIHGSDNDVFLVGDLRVDVGQQRVTRADIEITLPNLSLQLLIALIRVAPNVLSHELLMARVWPGLVVSPETVAKRVNLLREALGDDAQEPRYIAGVRSRGYQLVAAVSPAARPATPVVDHGVSRGRHVATSLEQSPRRRAGCGGSCYPSCWWPFSRSP